uniref:NADH dehydrogenase subunit 4 n=1 Tax=Euplotes cristatus TaxID=756077 RepID=UPI002E7AA4FB|nr:NADH dehydrogenase subunit 4 [Euplotes cristatus]UPM52067.1 NADH dehydrogenase subunit 4 [Euplotes cristatus]
MFFLFEYTLFLVVLFVVWVLVSGTYTSYRVFVSSTYLLFFSVWGVFFLGYFYFLLYDQLTCWSFQSLVPCIELGAGLANGLGVAYLWPFVYIYIFITLVTLIYCFSYNYAELLSFQLYIIFIFLMGGSLFFVNSLALFFFAYEAFLIPSFLILYNFAKTRKAVEAAFLMFFWTQLGAVFLIFNFQYVFFVSGVAGFNELGFTSFTSLEFSFLFWTLLVGFGVKFPVWPFYDWLPKAHVEASTNFSIFLSGVLVKFAFFGFLRYFISLGFDFIPLAVYPFLLVGFMDASVKIFYQLDLKKLIAYSTVIEMHWLVFAVLNGSTFFWIAGFAMMVSHALVSANFFILVDSVTRRFKTRLVFEVFGLAYLTPNLYVGVLFMLVVFLGFPGSLLFVAEFLFFSALLDFSFGLFVILFFFAYFFVPVCFFRSWFLSLFGFPYLTNLRRWSFPRVPDLALLEVILVFGFIVLLFWLGVTFQFFF